MPAEKSYGCCNLLNHTDSCHLPDFKLLGKGTREVKQDTPRKIAFLLTLSHAHQSTQWSFKLSTDRNITWRSYSPAPRAAFPCLLLPATFPKSGTAQSKEQIKATKSLLSEAPSEYLNMQVLPSPYHVLPADVWLQLQATYFTPGIKRFETVWAAGAGGKMKCHMPCSQYQTATHRLPQKTAASWGGNWAGKQKAGWTGEHSKNAHSVTAGTQHRGKHDRNGVQSLLDVTLPDSNQHKSYNCVTFTCD